MKLLVYRNVLALIMFAIGLIFAANYAPAEQVSAGETPNIMPDNQPQMQEITDALSRFRDRDVEGALKYLEAAAKKNPDLPSPYVLLARFYQEFNVPQGVVSALETAVQKTPEDPDAYVILAQIALRDRRVTEADLLLNKANSILAKFDKSPKRKESLMTSVAGGLAQVSQMREDWSTAQKYLEQWLKLDPKNATALQRLSYVLFQQKSAQAALEKLREAKAADSNVMTPEATLALFYHQFGDKENAKKWMAAALTQAPRDRDTQLIAAQMALENGQLEEAQSRAAAAMQIDPKWLEAKILRGRIALFQKDYKAAELYFEAAHLQSPGNFPASNFFALALIEQNDESKRRRALEFAENNVRQYPKSAEAAATLGWVLYKLGRLEDADRALQAALSSGNITPDTAYYAAVVAKERGRKEEAKRLLTAALKSTNPFTMKQDAAALLEQLNK
jgi:Tfp pilus assembly protein PilF